MNREVVNECNVLSEGEQISFPEVLGRLVGAGVESYYADLLSSTKTYYSKNSAYTLGCSNPGHAVADVFNANGVVLAIRQSQRGEIKYHAFLRKVMDAGVLSYSVFIQGAKVIYFGRKGEQHVEEFPK